MAAIRLLILKTTLTSPTKASSLASPIASAAATKKLAPTGYYAGTDSVNRSLKRRFQKNDYYVESVHFGFDEDQPLASERAKMDHFVQVAKANPSDTFKLVGNTDAKGSNAYNDDLSKRRVDNVAAYAESQGVPASQMQLDYKGKTDPVSTNDTEQGRADQPPRHRQAYRIAYAQLVEWLNDEVPVSKSGTLVPAWCSTVEADVEQAIETQMTAQGNLGNDPSDSSDTGVECKIDYDQNILATSQVKIGLRVKPNGYAKYIDVELGFKTA